MSLAFAVVAINPFWEYLNRHLWTDQEHWMAGTMSFSLSRRVTCIQSIGVETQPPTNSP